jgi:hypothetical protein
MGCCCEHQATLLPACLDSCLLGHPGAPFPLFPLPSFSSPNLSLTCLCLSQGHRLVWWATENDVHEGNVCHRFSSPPSPLLSSPFFCLTSSQSLIPCPSPGSHRRDFASRPRWHHTRLSCRHSRGLKPCSLSFALPSLLARCRLFTLSSPCLRLCGRLGMTYGWWLSLEEMLREHRSNEQFFVKMLKPVRA